jgi:hypothetical protein
MFGLSNSYDAVNYVQKITGYRCSHLSYSDFTEMKNCGVREAYAIDSLQHPHSISASPITMIGELKYLFNYYEMLENKPAMTNVAQGIAAFLKEYRNQIPEYSEMIINLPIDYNFGDD